MDYSRGHEEPRATGHHPTVSGVRDATGEPWRRTGSARGSREHGDCRGGGRGGTGLPWGGQCLEGWSRCGRSPWHPRVGSGTEAHHVQLQGRPPTCHLCACPGGHTLPSSEGRARALLWPELRGAKAYSRPHCPGMPVQRQALGSLLEAPCPWPRLRWALAGVNSPSASRPERPRPQPTARWSLAQHSATWAGRSQVDTQQRGPAASPPPHCVGVSWAPPSQATDTGVLSTSALGDPSQPGALPPLLWRNFVLFLNQVCSHRCS